MSSASFQTRHVILAAVLAARTGIGCEASTNDDADRPSIEAARPIDGLGPQVGLRFEQGLRDFVEVETVASGLGPLFNATSCAHCHNLGGVGGAGLSLVLRVQCRTEAGLVNPPGGSLVPMMSVRPDIGAAAIPAGCDAVSTRRRTTALFGAGLLEAIEDAEIHALAAAQPEAIRGRVSIVQDLVRHEPRVGRFGWKAQHASLESFTAEAYVNEMGITNEFVSEELAPNGDKSLLASMDSVADPEARVGGVKRLADFIRFLPPPTSAEDGEGLALFQRAGCDGCHVDRYRTSAKSELGERAVRAFSDLLLHDVGTGDGVTQASAGANEVRTAPLWGIAKQGQWLHDGRARSLREATMQHGGQATASRDAFLAMSPDEQLRLISFLTHL